MAEQVAQKLQEFGADVSTEEIPLADIKTRLTQADFSYDMIFTGMNLGLFYYNVASFLHSSQIKNGYNIIRLKDSTLDALLSRLTDRFYYNSPDKLRDIQLNIQKILEKESVVYTFGSPYEFIGTKNTLLGLKIPEFIA
ncbi:hypothetical protein H6768_01240 [Candidatus Peribacteria bacterium]|nr:hypothetical protein [Candidatus Peribacteria bacterium]